MHTRVPCTEKSPWFLLDDKRLLSVSTKITIDTIAHIKPAIATVVKRFGVKLLSHKNSKKRRQIGNMGDFGTGYVRKTIRQAGQMGYHQRTELNKRVLRISNPDESDVTPAGGFLHYGEVTNPYMIIQGSLPGPAKRLLRFRDAVRPNSKMHEVDLTYVSTSSKQGV